MVQIFMGCRRLLSSYQQCHSKHPSQLKALTPEITQERHRFFIYHQPSALLPWCPPPTNMSCNIQTLTKLCQIAHVRINHQISHTNKADNSLFGLTDATTHLPCNNLTLWINSRAPVLHRAQKHQRWPDLVWHGADRGKRCSCSVSTSLENAGFVWRYSPIVVHANIGLDWINSNHLTLCQLPTFKPYEWYINTVSFFTYPGALTILNVTRNLHNYYSCIQKVK